VLTLIDIEPKAGDDKWQIKLKAGWQTNEDFFNLQKEVHKLIHDCVLMKTASVD